MLFAIGFIFTFIHGGLTGLFLGNVTVDLPLSDTYFVVGHFHMVMGVSPILVLFARDLSLVPEDDRQDVQRDARQVHFWLTFLGTYAIYLPMHYLGIPRRAATLLRHGQYRLHSRLCAGPERCSITISALFVAAAQILFFINMFCSLRNGKKADQIPGARPRSNGRRRIRRRSTVTGATTCLRSIAGPMTTACPAAKMTSFRRTCCRVLHRRAATMEASTSGSRSHRPGDHARQPDHGWCLNQTLNDQALGAQTALPRLATRCASMRARTVRGL